jgi:hypothetical protein
MALVADLGLKQLEKTMALRLGVARPEARI